MRETATMISALDGVLLTLILVFYGIGDVATTLYGIRYCDLKEDNRVMTILFSPDLKGYESIIAKGVALLGVLLIYYLAQVWQSSPYLWTGIAILIILRGIQVTYLNWRTIIRA